MHRIYKVRSISYLYDNPPILFSTDQAYQAIINGRGQPHSAAVQYSYPDRVFLHNLEVTDHQWHDLLSDAGLSISMSDHTPLTYITHEVTPLAEQGRIEFYQLPDLDRFQHWVRKEQAYNFICSAEPHPLETRPPETFNTQADAEAFLDQFDLDNTDWVYFLTQHQPVLEQLHATKRVPVLMQEFDLRPVIAEMLLNEEIRVYAESDPWRWHTPPKQRAALEVIEVPVRNPPPMAPPSPEKPGYYDADAWKHATEDKFIDQYQQRYPQTTLTEQDLKQRYAEDKRLHPETGRLRDPSKTSRRPKIEIKADVIEKKSIAIEKSATLEGLEAERMDAEQRKLEAIEKGDSQAQAAATQEMRKFSEQIGEEATRRAMEQTHPEFVEIPSQLPGEDKRGQFDQIYYNPETGEIITLEAKGGGSQRGSRKTNKNKQAEQGTPEYRDSIIENMEREIEKTQKDPRYHNNQEFKEQIDALRSTQKKLKAARFNKAISSKQVSQRLNKDGSLKPEAQLISFSNDYTDPKP